MPPGSAYVRSATRAGATPCRTDRCVSCRVGRAAPRAGVATECRAGAGPDCLPRSVAGALPADPGYRRRYPRTPAVAGYASGLADRCAGAGGRVVLPLLPVLGPVRCRCAGRCTGRLLAGQPAAVLLAAGARRVRLLRQAGGGAGIRLLRAQPVDARRSEEHTSELQSRENLVCRLL